MILNYTIIVNKVKVFLDPSMKEDRIRYTNTPLLVVVGTKSATELTQLVPYPTLWQTYLQTYTY